MSFFFIIIKVLLLGIFSVHTPGYKNDLNCPLNQFTWVVTHPVRAIKGSDLLGFDSTAVKNRIKGKNTAIGLSYIEDARCLKFKLNRSFKD